MGLAFIIVLLGAWLLISAVKDVDPWKELAASLKERTP